MKGAASLRARLLLGALLWIVVALACAWVLLTDLFNRHVEEQLQAELESHLTQLLASIRSEPNGTYTLARPLSAPEFRKPYGGLYWQIADGEGEALLRSRSLWDATLQLPPDTLLDGETHLHEITGPDDQALIGLERAVHLPGADGLLRLFVARDAQALSKPIRSFGMMLGASLGILALGLIGAAAAQVALGLRPLARLRQALAGLHGAPEGTRLDRDYPDEVLPLVDDLNALMDHNDAVLARARTQAGNLAHGIRTPLTVIANEADRLERKGEKETAALLQEQLETARRYVDFELARARAAGRSGAAKSGTPVHEAAEALRRTLARLFDEKGLEIGLSVPTDCVFPGEREDLDEILGNLMENACKWATGRVAVSACRDADGGLRITVDDDGPGLPEAIRERAFERGARLDERPAALAPGGSGLGLAIVRDLAHSNGGDVTLDKAPIGGLRAVLRFTEGEPARSRQTPEKKP